MAKTLKFKEFIKINENNTLLNVEDIFKHYLIAALWSTTNMDNETENLDKNHTLDDIDAATKSRLYKNVEKFVTENREALIQSGLEDSQIGHSLWLSQNGHGAGFFDFNLDDDIEKQLMTAARNMKGEDLYIGNDNKIHSLRMHNESSENEVLEFDIPTWAITSLINGDDSGCSDEDIEKINKFVQKTIDKYGNANFMLGDKSYENDFKYTNDIDNLGSDVTTLYLRPSKITEELFNFVSTDYKSGLSSEDEAKLTDFLNKKTTEVNLNVPIDEIENVEIKEPSMAISENVKKHTKTLSFEEFLNNRK